MFDQFLTFDTDNVCKIVPSGSPTSHIHRWELKLCLVITQDFELCGVEVGCNMTQFVT